MNNGNWNGVYKALAKLESSMDKLDSAIAKGEALAAGKIDALIEREEVKRVNRQATVLRKRIQ